MYKLFTFEVFANTTAAYRKQRIMTVGDARRYAAVCDMRILEVKPVEKIGTVEVDDMYDIPIFGEVWKTDDGCLVLGDGTELSKWQKDNVLPIEEDTII